MSGEYARTSASTKRSAHKFVDEAVSKSAMAIAATPSSEVKTVYKNQDFHLDRQQATNAKGDHKVAVQLNKGPRPTTIGQVLINNQHRVAPKTVGATLKHSINVGPPDQRVPDSAKAQRIAKADADRLAKQQREAAKYKAGIAKAASGQTKKGGK
ncbi:hypothetical protein HYPSUDRAFT_79818 [Hypholoma sublateritium FD-334 SS-4]|uniref:Uncharacterized protein n=1 Tax=Hypholoma sublateritium (strain FD-334 SS-4) TaxID=945553 RepID=A0A0D2NKF5_HYPSF|nr:hypothetical protein HYPSUDRAFT_79818 [Hypholoma sublateritium FD-334 SS-4]